jgi:hypothetical protein
MSERDLLSRAARTLREEHTGQNPGSGFTRGRIMRQLHQKRRKRLFVWVGFSPLVALIAGSAWAAGSGSWHHVWGGVTRGVAVVGEVLFGAPERAEAERDRHLPSAKNGSAVDTSAAPAIASTAPLAIEPPLLEAPPVLSGEVHEPAGPVALPNDVLGAGRAARGLASVHAQRHRDGGAKPALRAPDPELVEFRRAHDAHFGATGHSPDTALSPSAAPSPSAAMRAYEHYLSAFPNGRFVPEARYNLGLLQLQNGQVAAGRKNLEPFAQAPSGSYRQAQAKAVLDALDAAR